MDNAKHQFALESYAKIERAKEDLKATLGIIGLPIEALCISKNASTFNVNVNDVTSVLMDEELKFKRQERGNSFQPNVEKVEKLLLLVKDFEKERGKYCNGMIALAFEIVKSIRTLRAEAHGIDSITHNERMRMREEGTEVRNFDRMADNKNRYRGFVTQSQSIFKDTFRETFKRSANYISWRTDFEAVASSEVGFAYTDHKGERHLLEAGKAEFVATSNSLPPCNPVFHFPQYWYQHCIRKNMETLWRDSNSYTVTVSGKLWMPLKLKKVEHPYYADEPHRQAYKCKLLRVQNIGKGGFVSAEIREGWLVADVREGSDIVMAFNEDFRKADRQLSTKVTTDVVDSLDI